MEQTTKYNSSGWRRNSLWLLLLFSVFAMGQSNDSATRSRLDSRYSIAMLEAHQANSLGKLTDFYHYLNLLSGTDDKQLQSQLKENIYALFIDKNILIEDLTTDKTDQIPLSYFLDSVASKGLTFVIKDKAVSREFYYDYWFDSYTLEVTAGGKKMTRETMQAVHFGPQHKPFGNKSKTVVGAMLGGIK
jgi:hypothetical protein